MEQSKIYQNQLCHHDSKLILAEKGINGNDWYGNNTISFQLEGYKTIACRLDLQGDSAEFKLFNTSTSGDGLIHYEVRPDQTEIINISNDFETFIKSVEYKKTLSDIKIRNILDLTTEQTYPTSFIGEIYHYNDSSYYIFNPFNNLSESHISMNASVTLHNSTEIILNHGGIIDFGIFSIAPFSTLPEARWNGSGSFNAYINMSVVSDISDWHRVYMYNTSFFNPLYNSNLNLIGNDHFFLRLHTNASANISHLQIQSSVSFETMDYVYLKPNTTNIVNIAATNINNSILFDYSYRSSYI